MGEMSLIRKDLNDIKVEIAFIKDILLDEEAGLEVSDEVVREVEESRKKKGKDLIPHEEVFKRYCK
ncbi:MAG TPA: hypothetical protein VJH65_00285 [Candidatus Nanoarchaeia archaeon]|nr:hypothetical protein [Candidatus Nanoarchaeia archaeon]